MRNGFLASSGGDVGEIKVWDTNTAGLVRTITAHSDHIKALVLLHSGDLASGSDDGTIKIWSTINNASLVSTLTGHAGQIRSLAVLENGLLASGAYQQILIWNTDNGDLMRNITGHSGNNTWVILT